jgi:N-acetylglucosamine-6-phosphate deacetylase
MRPIVLKNASAADGTFDRVSIGISDGVLTSIGKADGVSGEIVDCSELTVLPGFLDIHIHGAVGVDVNAADTNGLLQVAKFLARNGVTAWMPTLVPDSDDNYYRAIAAIDQLMKAQSAEPVAQVVGVHYEGIFASEKMCGALRPQFFKSFTGTEVADLPRLQRGVHMTTFAPEVNGGIELARELRRRGWIASIGHTSADVETLDGAFEAGARHITHFYNAMTGMHHRDLGVVGWAFSNRDVTFDIIADGVHVHPSMLEFACRTKSPDRVSLISDSVSPTGMGDGDFTIWGEQVNVSNGRTQNERGSIAGSVITMLDASKRMRSLAFTAAEVSRMGSFNPAKLLGLESTRGSIEIGKRADLILVDEAGELKMTLIGGEIVFSDL